MSDGAYAADLRCLACGQKLAPGALFCTSCGHPLGQEVSVSTRTPAHAEDSPDFLSPVMLQTVALFLLLLGSSLILGWVSRVLQSPWATVTTELVDAAVTIAFAISCHASVAPFLGLPRTSAAAMLQLAGLAVGFGILMALYFTLLSGAGVTIIQVTAVFRRTGWSLPAILFVVAVLPGIIEELAFRGVMQTSLERIVSTREALIVQAALFSVLHLLPGMFPSHFVMGLYFGYLRTKTRSLYPGMAAHAGWNALVVLQEIYGF
jgi:uncharacterized protein